MKKFILLLALLIPSVVFGAPGATLQNGSGTEVGTSANPLQVSVSGALAATLADDSTWVGNSSNVSTATALPNCADSGGNHLNYTAASNAFSCGTSGGASGANPSASVGTAAVNGSASTFLRSDGAPAIDQTMTPTWTGKHIFNAATTSFITGAGNVGIGTSVPRSDIGTSTVLDVTGASFGTVVMHTTGNTGAFNLQRASQNYIDLTGASTALTGNILNIRSTLTDSDVTGAALVTVMKLTPTGNLGIGTTNTNNSLSVLGNAAFGSYTPNTAPAGGIIVSGNTGIGTANPSSLLNIGGNVYLDRSTSQLIFKDSGGGGGCSKITMNTGTVTGATVTCP